MTVFRGLVPEVEVGLRRGPVFFRIVAVDQEAIEAHSGHEMELFQFDIAHRSDFTLEGVAIAEDPSGTERSSVTEGGKVESHDVEMLKVVCDFAGGFTRREFDTYATRPFDQLVSLGLPTGKTHNDSALAREFIVFSHPHECVLGDLTLF